MDITSLVEGGVKDGLFTDFDVCVRGDGVNLSFSGGEHIRAGARLFDVASITKACTSLMTVKEFAAGRLSPEDSFGRFIPVQEHVGDDRKLRHFLSYTVQNYAFDYGSIRNGSERNFKEVLVSEGFGRWNKMFRYDNVASAYVGMLLENLYGAGLETVLREGLLVKPTSSDRFLFHPVRRGLVPPEFVVPTRANQSLRGRVHDPASFSHEDTSLSVAGLFSDAATLADIFHRGIDEVIASGFYPEVATNQLTRLELKGNPYGLGFDIPLSTRFSGLSVKRPLIFSGHTGCRIFFAEKPRITVVLLTNQVLCLQNGLKQPELFKAFCWRVINDALRCVV